MSDLKHDIKNHLASMKAVVYIAKSQLTKGETEEVVKSLEKIDTKVDVVNSLLDSIPKSADGMQ